MRTVLTTLLFTFLVSAAAAQTDPTSDRQSDPRSADAILLKLAPEALERPSQQIQPNDLAAPQKQQERLSRLLDARSGPGEKVFTDFMPSDTVGVHQQTGNDVRLKDLSRWYRFPVRDTTDIEALASRLQSLPAVLEASPDYYASPGGTGTPKGAEESRETVFDSQADPPKTLPNDPEFEEGDQYAFNNEGGLGLEADSDVDGAEAWSLNKGRSDVTVAVVDGGVDLDHEDLDPGDRRRVIEGYDFGDDDNDPDDDRTGGDWADHGTPVAGTIGARTNNETGGAGMMWNLQIMPLKIAESNGDPNASHSNIAEAFNYARQNGADIINYSGSNYKGRQKSIVDEAAFNAYKSGLVVVASSGNDSEASVDFPAAHAHVMSVGATDNEDRRTGYSNYGPALDITAPSEFLTTYKNDDYNPFGGTSQAAPVISGIAGLVLSEGRDEGHNLSNNDIVRLIEETADETEGMDGSFDPEFGHGRANAYKALNRLNDPYEVSHGNASFEKVYGGEVVNFPDGITLDDGAYIGAGAYVCDIYELSASANFYYKETPTFWLPVPEKGLSLAQPNFGNRYLDKSVSKNSAEATTYFYDCSNVNGQDIWIPYNPNAYRRNGDFKYTVIGKPDTPPVEVTLSGPTGLNSGQQGTWSASVEGGSGSTSYDWESRSPGSYTWTDLGCSGMSCSHTFYNYGDIIKHGGVRVTVTKGSETDTAPLIVGVSPSCGDNVLICPGPGPGPLSANTSESSDETTSSAKADNSSVDFLALRSLQVESTKSSATLTWTTTGSVPPSRFVVQQRPDTALAWSSLSSVNAADSVQTDSTQKPAYQVTVDSMSSSEDAGANPQFRLAYQHPDVPKRFTEILSPTEGIASLSDTAPSSLVSSAPARVHSLRAESASGGTDLTWETEQPPSRSFVVQHRADSTASWSTLGTVAAGDSTSAGSPQIVAYRFQTDKLEIGTHQFRVGWPGEAGPAPRATGDSETGASRRYTKPVTAKIEMDEAYRLSTYPNPVQDQATVEVAVDERQAVEISLYDVLGREVTTLLDRSLRAQEMRRLQLNPAKVGLTSGAYFLQMTGEDFTATERITVVR